MGGSMIDVAIGLALIFALFSLAASAITDALAAMLNLRGRMLYSALVRVLEENGTKKLLAQPSIRPLQRKKTEDLAAPKRRNSPSYIPSWLFAAAATDIDLRDQTQAPSATNSTEELASKLADSPVANVVNSSIRLGAATVDDVRENLERWFDDYMERVSGWYKRRTQWILLVVGIFVAIGGNIDAVSLTRTLATDQTVTEQVLDVVETGEREPDDRECLLNALKDLPGGKLGLFWTASCPECDGFWEQRGLNDTTAWAKKLVGLLVGGVALSFGAPFWFDLIGRGKVLRSAGKKPREAG